MPKPSKYRYIDSVKRPNYPSKTKMRLTNSFNRKCFSPKRKQKLLYLNGRVRNQLQRPHDKKEHEQNILVTLEHLRRRQLDFRLNLVLVKPIRSPETYEKQG